MGTSVTQDRQVRRCVADARQRIRERLVALYGPETGANATECLMRLLDTHQQLRQPRATESGWRNGEAVLITYGDFAHSPDLPPLRSLRGFLDQHLPGVFSMVHVLPFYPWSSDGGFSVTDFRSVNPHLGDWDDIAALAERHDLVFDLILNHCSRENLWFVDYIAGQPPACDYCIEVDPNANLALGTRPRSSPVLSGVRTPRGLRHVWTTFSNDQIDMNYANPDVLLEFVYSLAAPLLFIRRYVVG